MHVRLRLVTLLLAATLAGGCYGGSAASGSRNTAVASPHVAPRPVASRGGGRGVSFDASEEPLPQVLAGAERAGRPPMLYFLAGWCGWCSKMRSETLPDARVGRHMAAFYNVSVDPDTTAGRALASRYGVNGFPTLLRLDGSGNVVEKLAGFRSPDELIGRVSTP